MGESKYQLTARERRSLQTGIRVSDHADTQWERRMPDAARDIEFAIDHARSDDAIVSHPHFGRHPKPTDAVLVYAGVPDDDEVAEYVAVMPVLDDTVTTAYRAASVPDYAAEWSDRTTGLALAEYLRILGRAGGVVHE